MLIHVRKVRLLQGGMRIRQFLQAFTDKVKVIIDRHAVRDLLSIDTGIQGEQRKIRAIEVVAAQCNGCQDIFFVG